MLMLMLDALMRRNRDFNTSFTGYTTQKVPRMIVPIDSSQESASGRGGVIDSDDLCDF